jgi:hypothetical protein
MVATPLRYLWALPTSAVGLVVAGLGLATRSHAALVNGVLEVHGGGVAWLLRHCVPLHGGAAALTLGHVVLARDSACLDATRPHERIHVHQCERWGPMFIPAYLAGGMWAWLNGKHPYHDNPFERAVEHPASVHRVFSG